MKARNLAACVAVLLSSATAGAVPITFSFDGVVTGVRDSGNHLDGTVYPGIPFAGTYTFESSVADSNSSSTLGHYSFASLPGCILTLRVGSYDLEVPLDSIYVLNSTKDFYQVVAVPFYLGSQETEVGFAYDDFTHDAFNSDSLPTEPPDLAPFEFGGFEWASTHDFGGGFVISGEIASITPEPASIVLILVGLAAACPRKK